MNTNTNSYSATINAHCLENIKRKETVQNLKDNIVVDLNRPYIIGDQQELMDTLVSLVQIAILSPYDIDAGPAILNFVLRAKHIFKISNAAKIREVLQNGLRLIPYNAALTTKSALKDSIRHITMIRRDMGLDLEVSELKPF